MESQVWRHGRVGSQAAEGAGGGEREAQADAQRRDARQCCAEGSAGKQMVTPAAERKAVAHLVEKHGISELRACKAIGCWRMTIRYQSTRTDDAVLRDRLLAIARER
jgi:putative transposase